MQPDVQHYIDFYDRVGLRNGWDFRRVRCLVEGQEWNFYDEVKKVLRKSDLLLDIGTGGGEQVLAVSDENLLTVGIDFSAGMIATANENLKHSGKSNVRFVQMDAERLQFPAGFFNMVTCRQAPFHAGEVARVLDSSGVFMTQQVSEADKLNLKKAFGRGQCYGCPDGFSKAKYVRELKEAGFSNITVQEYDAVEYYAAAEDLIFLLKHTPIIPEFGSVKEDFEILERFVKENLHDKGIRTNSKRYMITANRIQ